MIRTALVTLLAVLITASTVTAQVRVEARPWFNASGLSRGTVTIASGSEIVFAGNATIRRNTADGADNGEVVIAGGGTSDDARGGRVIVAGNENSQAGYITIQPGNIANARFRVWDGVTNWLQILESNGEATFQSTTGLSAVFNSTSANGGYVLFQRSGTGRGYVGTSEQLIAGSPAGAFVVRGEGVLSLNINGNSGSVNLAGSTFGPSSAGLYDLGSAAGYWASIYGSEVAFPTGALIRRTTADGADNGGTVMTGGGGSGTSRGGYIEVAGNENAATGQIRLFPGNVANAGVNMYRADGTDAFNLNASNGQLTLTTNASFGWNLVGTHADGAYLQIDVPGSGNQLQIGSTLAIKGSGSAVAQMISFDGGTNGALTLDAQGLMPYTDLQGGMGAVGKRWMWVAGGYYMATDGVAAPSATVGYAKIYVDSADGSLKVKFGNGTVKTLATNP